MVFATTRNPSILRLMGICGENDFMDFHSSCIRELWGAILPALYISVLCFAYLFIPRIARFRLGSLSFPFRRFLDVNEAEALGLGSERIYNGENREEGKPTSAPNFVPLWRTIILSFLGILQSFVWVSYGAYRAYNEVSLIWRNLLPFLVGVSWIYAAIRPIVCPTATPPYDLFTLYSILLAASSLQIGGFVFDSGVFGIPLPPTVVLVGHFGNLIAILILLAIVVSMPVAIPSNKVDRNELVSCSFCQPSENLSLHDRDVRYHWRTTRRFGVG